MKQSKPATPDEPVSGTIVASTQKYADKPLLWGKHCRGLGCDDFNEQRPSCICKCAACKPPARRQVTLIPNEQTAGGSPFCLDCGHRLTDADRQAPVCPYCGCA